MSAQPNGAVKILVLNCGSSSIKYKLFAMPRAKVLATGQVERIGSKNAAYSQKTSCGEINQTGHIADHSMGLRQIQTMLTAVPEGPIQSVEEIGACGHRVVHGGEAFTGSVPIDDAVEHAIDTNSVLAPLHNPPNLIGIQAAREMLGDVPQVACFDTAFHQTMPEVAYLYPLPYDLYRNHKIRKYGFHGTSHRYVAEQAAKMLGKPLEEVRLITCHLGNGCSITAIRDGESIDTSMGLTPLEGVMMGTRTGDLDPATIFHLLRMGYDPAELEQMYNRQSGLLGISEYSNDVRDLENRAAVGHDGSERALEMFAYRIKKYICMYLGILNGCDAVVFTGGIGENSPSMRARILSGMDNIGIQLDDDKNKKVVSKQGSIHTEYARRRLFVIPTDEEALIARDTYAIISNGHYN